jgi:hypothetical protein
VKERRKRELEPILKTLKEVQDVSGEPNDELKEFKKITKELRGFAEKSDGLLSTFVGAQENWFWNTVLKAFK